MNKFGLNLLMIHICQIHKFGRNLLINVSSRFYPSQKGEASIYANDIKSGKNIFSLEFAREFSDQTVHPFLLPINNASSDTQKPFIVYLK